MALSIKSDEADTLARELSRLTGESLTDAVTVSLRQRLDRQRGLGGDPVGDAIARARALLGPVPPGLDAARAADVLYDEHGASGLMVIDSSAIVGLLIDEEVNEAIIDALRADERKLLGAPTRLEMTIVMQRSGIVGGVESVRAALDGLDVIDVPFDRTFADLAIDAHARWGRGNHPAKLNFGDCFTYALAKQTGEAILCVGDDFARTDIAVVPLA